MYVICETSMEGGPGPTMWTTRPGRPALGAWKVGAGQGSWVRGTEGGHMVAKKMVHWAWKAGTGWKGRARQEVWQGVLKEGLEGGRTEHGT
jgi:hypothetical protein